MAAVLRVKRKASSTPEDKLIISRKRQKAESSSDEDETTTDQTILHFACTVTDPEDVAQHVAEVLPKLDAEKVRSCNKRTLSCDGNVSDVSKGKVSRLIGSDSITDRFKVINCCSVDALSKEKSEDKWTLIDIEDSWSISKKDEKKETSSDDTVEKEEEDNAEEKDQVKEDMEEYVYDLYCAQTHSNIWIETGEIMIQHCDYFVPEQYSDEDRSTIDSNSESHWRNDYPDDSDSNSSDSNDCYSNDKMSSNEMSENEEHELFQCNAILSKLRTWRTSNVSNETDESEKETSSDNSNNSFGIM